jgi:hypothetical protein
LSSVLWEMKSLVIAGMRRGILDTLNTLLQAFRDNNHAYSPKR